MQINTLWGRVGALMLVHSFSNYRPLCARCHAMSGIPYVTTDVALALMELSLVGNTNMEQIIT